MVGDWPLASPEITLTHPDVSRQRRGIKQQLGRKSPVQQMK